MCAPKMPEPPDPFQTGAAQTQTNIDTAIANNRMGMVDQVTPYGNLTYETIWDTPQGQPSAPQQAAPVAAPSGGSGARRWDEAQGRYVPLNSAAPAQAPQQSLAGGFSGMNVPRYRATTTLAPDQQRILDASTAARGNLAELANERAGFLKSYLPNATPDAIDERLYNIGAQRLDPRFAREDDALRTRLANQGLTQGSAAWNAEMERLGQDKNDAYNQLILSGRGQALSEINNPINQITALLSQSQVQNPNVQMAQPSRMPTVDQAGLIQQNYGQRLQNAQQQAQYRQSLLGGLFDIGSAGIGGGFF
jgi:hypothetical protein